jgi:hypothetical protein
VHIKVFIYVGVVFLLLGCQTDDVRVPIETDTLYLKQNTHCIEEAQMTVKRLAGKKRVFMGKELFKESNYLYFSTGVSEVGVSGKMTLPITLTFVLFKKDEKCYIGKVNGFEIDNKALVNCSCIEVLHRKQ